MNDTGNSGLARMRSGIPGLDAVLCGGLFKGGLYIVQGAPGTGKTTLGNQICFSHVADGERALYATLLAEYHARMIQHLSSMSFFDAARIPDKLSYISGFRILREEGFQGLLGMLRREIGVFGASVLMLDGFATAQRAAASGQDFNEFVHELQGIALATDCTMFLLSSSSEGTKNTPEYTMVDGILELSDRRVGWSAERAMHVLKLRGSDYLPGRHVFRITDDGIVVYPRIEALLAIPSRPDLGRHEKVASGVNQLDAILGGGLPAASTTLIIGPTGVGKTTLGLQFLSRCSETEPGLLFGFYETPARIAVKADGVCRPLRGLIEAGTVEMVWQPPVESLLDACGKNLLEAVNRRGVRRLFIDGLTALRNIASDPGRMGHFLNALVNELRVLGVTTMYTLEVPNIIGPTFTSPISDSSNLAENLILMRFVELRSQLFRLMAILKVRDSDFDPSLYEFTTSDQGLVIKETFQSAEAITAGQSRLDGGPNPDEALGPSRNSTPHNKPGVNRNPGARRGR